MLIGTTSRIRVDISEVYRSSVEWNPSAVVALATSADGLRVAAARSDGSVEIWLVSPGSIGWHCQLIIHGDPNSRVSSLVWCRSGPGDGSSVGRLLSSSIDGSVSEWDFLNLRQKIVLDSVGVSIWQIAAEPCNNFQLNVNPESKSCDDCDAPSECSEIDELEKSDSDDDGESTCAVELLEDDDTENTGLALACDDGRVRIYCISDAEKLTYRRSLPRVSGRALSVTWSPDAKRLYSGSSDGFIRCWDAKLAHEIYRITAGLGGLNRGIDLCIWSLIALRCGTIVSADSSGAVQFWDSQFGTLLHAHSHHKGDVNALVASPSHNKVFSAGSDGQVILYKCSRDTISSGNGNYTSGAIRKWIYVGFVRVHTHDVRSLTIATPISHEDMPPEEKLKRPRGWQKPLDFPYHKWAHLGEHMLISAGDDAKLFAYPAKEFTKFSPHDICPVPQRMDMQLVHQTEYNQTPLLLVQASHWLDIYCIRTKNNPRFKISSGPSGGIATTNLVARVKRKAPRRIICSTISSSGTSIAYSDHVKPNLFELRRSKMDKGSWTVHKRKLPRELPSAFCMIFSSDSSRLLLAGRNREIYVVDVRNAAVIHAFTPCREDEAEKFPPREPPFSKMFTSPDGRWLSSINCCGDVHIFNLETLRQHWFISRLEGASVVAGGFTPQISNILIISISTNKVYALDVEAKQFCDWCKGFSLPRKFQEFPGGVIGLSFQQTSGSLLVIIYSPRAMCLIDIELPVEKDKKADLATDDGLNSRESHCSGGLKLKLRFYELEQNHGDGGKLNSSEICDFRDPVLFVEHLTGDSLLVIDKPWTQVVETLETRPVHKHIFGT